MQQFVGQVVGEKLQRLGRVFAAGQQGVRALQGLVADLLTLAAHPGDGGLASGALPPAHEVRSEEHTSELQSLMRISYAVFCLKKKKQENKSNKGRHQKSLKN